MKEIIKEVRERKGGFTMAELLIVVAIVAVLVAIAIPVFSGQLEKSKEATDVANIRNYYAEITTHVLDGSLDGTTGHTEAKLSGGLTATRAALTGGGNGYTVTVAGVTVAQGEDDWKSAQNVAGVTIATDNNMHGKTNIVYTFTTDTTGNGNDYLSAISFS